MTSVFSTLLYLLQKSFNKAVIYSGHHWKSKVKKSGISKPCRALIQTALVLLDRLHASGSLMLPALVLFFILKVAGMQRMESEGKPQKDLAYRSKNYWNQQGFWLLD